MKSVSLVTLQEVMNLRGRQVGREAEDVGGMLDQVLGKDTERELVQDIGTSRMIEEIKNSMRATTQLVTHKDRRIGKKDDNQQYAKFLYAVYPDDAGPELKGKVIPYGQRYVAYRRGKDGKLRTVILRSRYI